MSKRTVLVVGLLMTVVSQAKHPTFSKNEWDGTYRNFDIVVAFNGDPDPMTRNKMENVISNAADAVFECTEGVHRWRTVRIYTNGKMKKKSDINWWGTIEYPFTQGSVGANGVINFANSSPKLGFLLENPEEGGYVMTHEWVHYAYSLYDEYLNLYKKDFLGGDTIFIVTPSLMANGPKLAVGGNYEHLNFSVAHRGGNPFIGFTPFENTQMTWQHAMYGKSCWETLAVPEETSLWTWLPFFSKEKRSLYPRTFYPELAAVAPDPTLLYPLNLPTIQLDKPGAQAVARGVLEIIWMDEPVIQLVLDQSGSMGGTPLANVKAAAQNLIDAMEEGMSVGILAFADSASVVAPVTQITDNGVRASLKAAIAGITAGGGTAIGGAMQTALDGLKSYGISNRAAAVFLLSDGVSNAGADPLDVAAAYQTANVPVFGFGYGNSVDPRLKQISFATGGKYFASPVSYKAVRKAFAEAYTIFSDRAITLDGSTDPADIMGFMATTEPVNIPFFVDSDMVDLRLSIVYSGADVSAVSLGLLRPDSTLLTVAPTNAPDGSILLEFHINSPMAGEWAIVGTRESDTHISYLADAKTAWGGYHLDWIAFEQPEDSEEYLTVVSLRGEADIDGAQVTGQIRFENGETVSCVFSNFAAGLYGAMNTATHTGRGTMTVTASNPYGTAFKTWRDAEIDTFGEEDPEPPEDEPITENFTRIISERIDVTSLLCDVTFSGNGGDPASQNVWQTKGHKYILPVSDPTRTDYLFKGWFTAATGGTQVTAATTVATTTSHTLYAQWYALRYVDASFPDDSGDGTSWATAKRTVQAAVDAALADTMITVTNGVYGPISTDNKSIIIQSVNGADVTFIDGGGTNRCATLGTIGTHTNTVLIGLTLTNGWASNGAGTLYGTLNDCVLVGNTATDRGGGSYYGRLNNCTLRGNTADLGGGACFGTLNGCVVSGNTADSGGGAIGAMYDMMSLNNCVLSGNTATSYGGGAYSSMLNNCVLTGNTAIEGGGSYNGTLNNCVLTGNTATSYGGGACYDIQANCTLVGNTVSSSYGGGAYYSYLDNCIVWGNTAAGGGDNHYNTTFRYSCTTPLPTVSYDGGGNISTDPLFEDALAGNFRLRMKSPCINAGTNPFVVGTVDLDGKPRIRDGTVDMGAYEYDKLRPAPGIPVPIPFDWLDLYLGWGGLWDYAGLANATGANGYPVWQSYVAGLDPTDAGSKFRIFNFRTDGTEVTALDWTPHRSDRTYTVWGKTNLTDALWHSPTNSGTQFFRVKVKMP